MAFDIIEKSVRSGSRDSRQGHNALVAGTVVLTLDGALPVEFISAGDRVITRDSGTAIVRDVRRSTRTLRGISIKAGSLGNARPDRDVILSATQEVLIRDWRADALFGGAPALVAAERLVDGEFVRETEEYEAEMVELVFDTPHILYADGLEVASGSLL
ncbi:Hint domain-containing protein [Pacificoceanicola onchidii]|uniref:Hint domain-containing protein n=1 Tax=Pacificoceanicola onchidii TaxID=2562685 RepID=UPI0010A63478|nr:Hint domain-containing protein [Pacificoceanicola onchidii]